MTEAPDDFKTPSLPPSSSSSHVVFTLPKSKKITEDVVPIDSFPEAEEPVRPDTLSSLPTDDAEEKKESVGEKKPGNVESLYKPPVWSGPCTEATYDLDILKDGRIVGNIILAASGDNEEQTKPYYILGRQGDIIVEHPSISRHHAVIQYRSIGDQRERGWYIYDLGSTHGTFLNKEKVSPFMHVRIRVGHMFKLGFSSRMYILNGPEEDREPELGLSVTDIKQIAEKQKLLMSKRRDQPVTHAKEKEDIDVDDKRVEEAGDEKVTQTTSDSGIDWGLSDDYGEEEGKQNEEEEGESAMETIEEIQKREQFYTDDPRKALKNFFDRQNAADEMQFEYSEKGTGSRHQWTCRIELPIENESGRAVFAEATTSGSKKEATIACALEACRILDSAGVLRSSAQEGRKRKSKQWAEDDFYESDEDTFLDRTGDVERKRAKRMRQVAAELEGDRDTIRTKADTHDMLLEKLKAANEEINRTQQQLDLIRAEAAQDVAQGTTVPGIKDSLDAYMAAMSQQDIHEAKMRQSRLRLKIAELKKSAERLERLVKLTKPATLPPITVTKVLDSGPASKKQPVIIGTMKGHKMRRLIAPTPTVEPGPERHQKGLNENVEEVEEVDEEKEPVATAEDVTADLGSHKSADLGSHRSAALKSTSRSSVLSSSAEKSSFPEQSESSIKDNSVKVYTVTPPSTEVVDDAEDDMNEEMEPGGIQSSKSSEIPDEQKSVQGQPPKKRRQRQNRNKPAAAEKDTYAGYDPGDIDYAVWLPPDNQSGDGRTSLNEKFGY